MLTAFLVLLFTHTTSCACAKEQTISEIMDAIEKNGSVNSRPDAACICSVLNRADDNDAAALITTYTKHVPVSDTLLFCAFRHPRLHSGTIWQTLLNGWKKAHPALGKVTEEYRRTGAIPRLDTLLRILDSERALGAYQLLQWIEVKEVLDDMAPVPALFYRILQQRPQLKPLALNRFEQLLDGLDKARTDSLLQRFAAEATTDPRTVPADLHRWIIGQYGRKHLYTRELAMAQSIDVPPAARCSLLLLIGHSCMATGSYSAAIAAGKALLRHPCDSALRREAALYLFTAYKAADKPDSAAIWLEKSGIASTVRRREAIELYLSLGENAKASKQLGKMAPSLMRDTLYLRYLLLADSLGAARRFTAAPATHLARSGFPRLAWRFRVLFL
ncbi:MAG: hypothetical protein JW863_12945, partial [Chitinispirillaceae bacterium]|nr:hypothetical protein [Chitinispirillaceae bacterium]